MSTDLATTAKEHARTSASLLEGMACHNPLGTIADAVVIGLLSRGTVDVASLKDAVRADIDRHHWAGLLMLALILMAMVLAWSAPALPSRPRLQIAQPAALIGTLTRSNDARTIAGRKTR